MRRFVYHILPLRLRRLRYYGLLAPEKCNVKLALCRRLLSAGHGADLLPFDDEPPPTETEELNSALSAPICPRCEMPGMRHLGKLNAQELQRAEIRVQLLEERLVKVYRTDTLDPAYRITLDTDWHVAQALGSVEFVGLPLPEW